MDKEYIKKICEKYNILQKDLAEQIGMNPIAFSKAVREDKLSKQTIKALELFIQTKELKVENEKVTLWSLNTRHLNGNKENLGRFLKKFEKVVKKNEDVLGEDFLLFDYSKIAFKDGVFKLDLEELAKLINEINLSNLNNIEIVLAFWALMYSIGALEDIPQQWAYKKIYFANVLECNVWEVDTDLLSFKLIVKDKYKEKKFFFAGEEISYFQEDIIFGVNQKSIYVKNAIKMSTDTADFNYFFINDTGFIQKDEGVFKTFKEGNEVVKKKIYDEFETVDEYII